MNDDDDADDYQKPFDDDVASKKLKQSQVEWNETNDSNNNNTLRKKTDFKLQYNPSNTKNNNGNDTNSSNQNISPQNVSGRQSISSMVARYTTRGRPNISPQSPQRKELSTNSKYLPLFPNSPQSASHDASGGSPLHLPLPRPPWMGSRLNTAPEKHGGESRSTSNVTGEDAGYSHHGKVVVGSSLLQASEQSHRIVPPPLSTSPVVSNSKASTDALTNDTSNPNATAMPSSFGLSARLAKALGRRRQAGRLESGSHHKTMQQWVSPVIRISLKKNKETSIRLKNLCFISISIFAHYYCDCLD